MNPDLERLIGRAVINKKFRDELLADPEGTIKKAGFKLTAEELQRLKAGLDRARETYTADQLDRQFGTTREWW